MNCKNNCQRDCWNFNQRLCRKSRTLLLPFSSKLKNNLLISALPNESDEHFNKRFSTSLILYKNVLIYYYCWIEWWYANQYKLPQKCAPWLTMFLWKSMLRFEKRSIWMYVFEDSYQFRTELSTGNFSWTRPGETLTRPAIADEFGRKVWPDPPNDMTRGPTFPPYVHSLFE